MTIAGVASALPQNKYDQRVLLQALQKHWGPKVDNPVFLERLQARVGVETRYLALPIAEYYGLTRWGDANNHWIDVAQDLGQKALCCALARSGFSTEDLGAIFFVSVTGISSPSIDARLVNRMNLPVNIKRMPIFGLGCVAGAAGISRAADYVLAYPKQVAAVLSVELCSLTLQQEDVSIANIISSGLFGDGAAAVLVSGAERKADGPEILATKSIFYPNSEHVMGWDISEKGFRIVLSREVPEVVQDHLASDVDAFLEEQGLSRSDIGAWVLHTGGPRVLEATQAALGLPEGALAASWDCLRRTGNLSSASVLLVLEEVMMKRRPAPGTYSILAAMGPGFCSELVLLKW
ncbi:MAG: type III polyketide synthase [Bryobacteraceae bacterium]